MTTDVPVPPAEARAALQAAEERGTFQLSIGLVEEFLTWVDGTGEDEGRTWQPLVGQLADQSQAARDPFPPGTRVAFVGPATSNWKNRPGTVLGPTDHRRVRFDDIATYNEVPVAYLEPLAEEPDDDR